MPALTIVANIVAKTDKVDLLKTELQKLVEVTLQEKGCIQYELNQDNTNTAFFRLFVY